MSLKLKDGEVVLGPGGLPETTDGLEEVLQNALLRLTIPKGSFPYGRDMGSGLSGLNPDGEHREEQALTLANEALLDMPGVRAESAVFPEGGGIQFTLSTPLGEGEIVYGKI